VQAMAWITLQDAVHIYARFVRAHHHGAAFAHARDRAEALKAAGDREGCRVWNAVAREIETLDGDGARK